MQGRPPTRGLRRLDTSGVTSRSCLGFTWPARSCRQGEGGWWPSFRSEGSSGNAFEGELRFRKLCGLQRASPTWIIVVWVFNVSYLSIIHSFFLSVQLLNQTWNRAAPLYVYSTTNQKREWLCSTYQTRSGAIPFQNLGWSRSILSYSKTKCHLRGIRSAPLGED
jgi:hypothetical protein